jgi:hypothetical protein
MREGFIRTGKRGNSCVFFLKHISKGVMEPARKSFSPVGSFTPVGLSTGRLGVLPISLFAANNLRSFSLVVTGRITWVEGQYKCTVSNVWRYAMRGFANLKINRTLNKCCVFLKIVWRVRVTSLIIVGLWSLESLYWILNTCNYT